MTSKYEFGIDKEIVVIDTNTEEDCIVISEW